MVCLLELRPLFNQWCFLRSAQWISISFFMIMRACHYMLISHNGMLAELILRYIFLDILPENYLGDGILWFFVKLCPQIVLWWLVSYYIINGLLIFLEVSFTRWLDLIKIGVLWGLFLLTALVLLDRPKRLENIVKLNMIIQPLSYVFIILLIKYSEREREAISPW